MDRTVTKGEYRFNEQGHVHEILVDGKWKALTGCTTVLSILAKPALIQWSANMAVSYVQEGLAKLNNWEYREKLPKILEEAKTAHRRKKEEAGLAGTDVHKEAELLVAVLIATNKGMLKGDEKSELPQVQHFIDWAIKNKVKFIESEKHVYSKSLFLGGILDLVVEIDGKLWIADIKTSSGIYFEAFWQMAGYELMLKEAEYPELSGYIVLNLKKNGEFEEKRSISNDDAQEGFLACLEIYRLQAKFNNIIK